MASYQIGTKAFPLDVHHARVLKQLVSQVANKLNLSTYHDKIRCGSPVDVEWLGEVLEELDRWYLDDFDPEVGQMTIPKEDVTRFKELGEILTAIASQNSRKSEKFITMAQAKVLSKDFSSFLSEFTPEEQTIQDFHRNGYQLPKTVLHELITRVQEGIEKGKKIQYRD